MPHPVSYSLQRHLMHFDRFNRALFVTIVLLLAAIGWVILRGDQVGISVQSYGPTGQVGSRTPLNITFGEPIAPDTLINLQIDPRVAGKMVAKQNQISFVPSSAWRSGQEYTVKLFAGLRATSGRLLKQDVKWQFTVLSPRIAYLGPLGSTVQNLYLITPDQSDRIRQLTGSSFGVVDFDTFPDGSGLVYAQTQADDTVGLYRLDFATGSSQLLYPCQDALCKNPAIRPDGSAIAFEKIDLNTGSSLGPGVARVWILDLSSGSVAPLYKDNQKLGHMPLWSPDGTRIVVYDAGAHGMVIHDFNTNKDSLIAEDWANTSQFSPDGRWLYYFKGMLLKGSHYVTHLVLVDVSGDTPIQRDLVDDNDGSSDVDATWQADSKSIIVARKLAGARDADSPQLYAIDVATGSATLLVADQHYNRGDLSLDPSSDVVFFQRFAAQGSDSALWLYNLTTRTLKEVAPNVSFARWVP